MTTKRNKTVELTIAPCYRRGNNWCGDFEVSKVTRLEFPSIQAAKRAAWGYKAKCKVVIVRPLYNEKDKRGQFFRDWRSFDGCVLRECVFREWAK